MRVFLVRHVQTASNRSGRYSAKEDEAVADDQWLLIKRVAAYLSGQGIRRVYSSPLRRARETAAPLAELVGTPVEVLEDLREIRWAPSWEGHTKSEIAAAFPAEYQEWRLAPQLLSVDGQETLQEVQARAVRAMNNLAKDDPEQTCAVFTHDAVIRLLMLRALDLGPVGYRRLLAAHGRVSCLMIDRNVWTIMSLNHEVSLLA